MSIICWWSDNTIRWWPLVITCPAHTGTTSDTDHDTTTHWDTSPLNGHTSTVIYRLTIWFIWTTSQHNKGEISNPTILVFHFNFAVVCVLFRDVIGEEDNCLTLNVYTRGFSGLKSSRVEEQLQEEEGEKTKSSLLPVLVWIHGGGFAFGSGSDSIYGPERAMNQAIVLVTINYRLGALGFLQAESCPANLGLHDQRSLEMPLLLLIYLI